MCLPLQRSPSPLPLQCQRGDQALDLGGLAVGLAVLALKGAPVCVHVLAHIIILGQVEELPDLGSPLGSPQARLVLICQSRQLTWACTQSHHTITSDLNKHTLWNEKETCALQVVMLYD